VARSLGDSIKDEIWRELAVAKYRRWEDESAARCAERSMLKQRLAKALAVLQAGERDGCQVSVDDLVGSESKCRQSPSQCVTQALAAWQVGELNGCQVLLAQTPVSALSHTCVLQVYTYVFMKPHGCSCAAMKPVFLWRFLQALGVPSCWQDSSLFLPPLPAAGPFHQVPACVGVQNGRRPRCQAEDALPQLNPKPCLKDVYMCPVACRTA